jgi:hypothetical protein
MSITILDYVAYKTGVKDTYGGADFGAAGVDMIGGCERCYATLACYSAYPSTSGYWRCADCIGDTGYATVTQFDYYMEHTTARVFCPDCSGSQITEDTPGSYSCEECGAEWTT